MILFAFCCGKLATDALLEPKNRKIILFASVGLLVLSLLSWFLLWYFGLVWAPFVGTRNVDRQGQIIVHHDEELCVSHNKEDDTAVVVKCSDNASFFDFTAKTGKIVTTTLDGDSKCLTTSSEGLVFEDCSKDGKTNDNSTTWNYTNTNICTTTDNGAEMCVKYTPVIGDVNVDTSRDGKKNEFEFEK